MKILLLEDCHETAKLLHRMLEEYTEIEWVENGNQGLDWLNKIKSFNLIISDYHMPGMDGLEFIAELRKITSSIPVILFTANKDIFADREKIKKQYDIQRVMHKDTRQLVEFVEKYKISLTM